MEGSIQHAVIIHIYKNGIYTQKNLRWECVKDCTDTNLVRTWNILLLLFYLSPTKSTPLNILLKNFRNTKRVLY